MLNAARVHGSPMIVIAMKIAAITQPAAIHRPPKRIHRRLSKKEKTDMAFLRDLGRWAFPGRSHERFGAGQKWIRWHLRWADRACSTLLPEGTNKRHQFSAPTARRCSGLSFSRQAT